MTAPDRPALARAMIDIWNSGERDLALHLPAYADPAIELESPFSSLNGAPYEGYAGIEQWTRDVDEQFVSWLITIHELREVGDLVVAIVTVSGQGRRSDFTAEFPSSSIWEFGEDDRVRRVRIYSGHQRALEIAAFEEQG